MNTQDAIKILKKLNYRITKVPKGFELTFGCDPDPHHGVMSARELIKMAKCYTSENNQNTAAKSNLKHYDTRKNRAATKEIIRGENFDKLSPGQKAKEEDYNNWM